MVGKDGDGPEGERRGVDGRLVAVLLFVPLLVGVFFRYSERELGEGTTFVLACLGLLVCVLLFLHAAVRRLEFEVVPATPPEERSDFDLDWGRPIPRKWLFAHFKVIYALLGMTVIAVIGSSLSNGA